MPPPPPDIAACHASIGLETVLDLLARGAGRALLSGSFAQAAREFAPGVVTTIAPDFEPDDTVSTHDLVEIRTNPESKWQPELMTESRTLYGMSEGVKFRRDVSCLEFSFKPLRMIDVDVPGPGGQLERKLVWYLVYSVRNTGETRKPSIVDDGVVAAVPGQGGPLQFVPQFVLEAHDLAANGEPIEKSYLDRLIPAAFDAIQAREARGRKLLNSVEMSEQCSSRATAGSTTACGAWRRGKTSIRGSTSSRSSSAG